jgi:DNA polymerase-4
VSDEVRAILHVDMDAFYASVELNRHPEFRDKPVVVGGDSDRGVVAAASYVARSYGIHSAMASSKAKRLCPHVVFLQGDHGHYGEISKRVMDIFRSYTPLVEPLSLDEAFLDVTGSRQLFGSATGIAHRIRAEVYESEALTCSVGVATTKFIAKLATEAAKPKPSRSGPVFGDGVHVVRPGTEFDFIHPLPVKALWGVGPRTLEKLNRIGIETVRDLAALPQSTVISAVGNAAGTHLHNLANGIDERDVEPGQEMKSISHEETFAKDLFAEAELQRETVRMSDAVASRARSAGFSGRTVQIKIRFGDFTTITRSATSPDHLDGGTQIARIAKELLSTVDISPGVRLLGVGLGTLKKDADRQLSLDDAFSEWNTAEDAIDEIRQKFGRAAIGPAALAKAGALDVKREGDTQWGPKASLDDSVTEKDQKD